MSQAYYDQNIRPRLLIAERFIIENRVTKEDPMTLKEIAEELGVFRERVQQLEIQAKEKVRSFLGFEEKP